MRWLALTARPACRENLKFRECQIEAITSQPQRVAELRARLSDISWFVRLMCQTVARQCNIEDGCSGRFFEERFKLHRLESESDVLACMAYVDLNPLRAGMVDSLDDPAAQVSIGERLRGLDDQQVDPSSWLAPLELASEVDGQPVAVVNDLSAEEIERRRYPKTISRFGVSRGYLRFSGRYINDIQLTAARSSEGRPLPRRTTAICAK